MERAELYDFAARAGDLRRRDDVDAALVAVLDCFDAARVRSLVLKGPALARLLYRTDEHRGYRDVDVLVAPEDLPGARRALAALGYENVSEQQGVEDVAGILHDETWLRYGRGVPLVTVDLHWRLAGCDAPPQVAWDALAARTTSIELGGRSVTVLDRTGLALHLATHAVQHGGDGIKAMADLRRGIERWPLEVWSSAAALAGEVQATPALAAGLRLVPAGAALAQELALPPTDERTWAVLQGAARPRGAFHLEALAHAGGFRESARVLRRALIPTPAWIAWEYRWAGGSRVRLLAGYGRHLLRTPVWAARAWRFRRRARRAVRAGRAEGG